MTSNVGSRKLQDFGEGIGFTTGSKDVKRAEEEKHVITKALKNRFSPEFLNRVDETVIFNPLDKKQVCKITEIEVGKLSDRLSDVGYVIKFNKSVINHISDTGFDEKYGARPIRRAIQDKLENFISEEVLRENIVKGKTYTLSYDKKDDIITMKSR